MDTKLLVENLNRVFCNQSKQGIKYIEVWLEEADFGGLYNSGKYILNVKAEHPISSCFDEIDNILEILHNEAPEEEKFIYAVNVYDRQDVIHCEGAEIPVFTEASACP